MFAGLLVTMALVLAQAQPISLRFGAFEYAGESAAWSLKWVALPAAVAALWICATMCKSIREAPKRLAGRRLARLGLISSAAVIVLVATLIGVTVPDRWRQHRAAADAAAWARAYTIVRAMMEYRESHGKVASDFKDVLRDVPDPDGSIAEAFRDVDPNGYTPGVGDLAVGMSPKAKSQSLRVPALRNAETNPATDQLDHISYTHYELRLPGKILGTDDDLIVRDGFVTSELPQQTKPATARSKAP
jgi:hypothetical protein